MHIWTSVRRKRIEQKKVFEVTMVENIPQSMPDTKP